MTETWELTLQDVMRLDNQARMNTPGKAAGNWAWRVGDASVSNTFVHAALLVHVIGFGGNACMAP